MADSGGFYKTDNRYISDGHYGYLQGVPDGVLQCIRSHANHLGICHLKTSTIAAEIRYGENAITRALKLLRDPTQCYVISRRSRDCNYFELQALPKNIHGKSRQTTTSRASKSPDHTPKVVSGIKNPTDAMSDTPDTTPKVGTEEIPDHTPKVVSRSHSKGGIHENKTQGTSTPSTPSVKNNGDGRGEYSDDFKEFYNAYPRHVGKRAAYKSYLAAQKRRGEEKLPEMDELLAILEKHKAHEDWQKDGGKFVPHPATWLNGSRWTDEIMQSTGSKVSVEQQQERKKTRDADWDKMMKRGE